MMATRRVLVFAVVLLCTVCVPFAATSAQEADAAGDDEAVLRGLIEEWAAAAEAKDVDGFVSVYAPDAVVMLEGVPDMHGVDAIRAGIGGLMQDDPNFSLSFEATEVVVAEAGDMAYETGTFELSMSDPEGEATTMGGPYVVVWRKQADGSWKVVVDAPVSDPPAEAAD